MRRKAVIHHKQTVRVRSMASLAGEAHLHFCSERECRKVYEDCCLNPAANGRCHECRGVRRPIWMSARDPQRCCQGNCAHVTNKATLRRYNLAGPGPWYQCKTCARVHGRPCA